MSALRSPRTGALLHADSAHSLASGPDDRWPVVEGIPFLRADRRALADAALAALDAGRQIEALVLLLADQDNWARTPPPDAASRRYLVENAGALGFRSAMDLLAFGPVGTYFAHRWSDPTFLSGLALAEAYAPLGSVFELACGAGHFLREFGRTGVPTGGDIVFAKLWLARRYIAPHARLFCFDAAAPWPFADQAFDSVFCHDAFYFLPEKPFIAAEMKRTASKILIGHAHNALVDNLSSGSPMSPAAYAALFGEVTLYDDRELTAALIDARAPRAEAADALAAAPALSWAYQAGTPRPVQAGLAIPPPGTRLRRNPLYQNARIAWPSERYAKEYGPLATYPQHTTAPDHATAGDDPVTDGLARRRVLLDLPTAW